MVPKLWALRLGNLGMAVGYAEQLHGTLHIQTAQDGC